MPKKEQQERFDDGVKLGKELKKIVDGQLDPEMEILELQKVLLAAMAYKDPDTEEFVKRATLALKRNGIKRLADLSEVSEFRKKPRNVGFKTAGLIIGLMGTNYPWFDEKYLR